jgi:hypothetical protein
MPVRCRLDAGGVEVGSRAQESSEVPPALVLVGSVNFDLHDQHGIDQRDG